MRIIGSLLLAGLCAACTATTSEVLRFQPRAGQEAMMRDGRAALVSKGKLALVTVGQVNRTTPSSGRSVLVLTIKNNTKTPLEFRVDKVNAVQLDQGEAVRNLRVFTYDDLAGEERSNQTGRTFMAAMVAGVNRYEADSHGYYARVSADNRNAKMLNRVEAEGQRKQAMLESSIIKDHTLMPGETYGGQLHIQMTDDDRAASRNYMVAIMVGSERHEIEVQQGRVPQ